jgi:hypothetical protein
MFLNSLAEPFTMETEIFKQHACWCHTVARYVCCFAMGIFGCFGDVPLPRLFNDGAKNISIFKIAV